MFSRSIPRFSQAIRLGTRRTMHSGRNTNPGNVNFANRPKDQVRQAARKGGHHSHGGGRPLGSHNKTHHQGSSTSHSSSLGTHQSTSDLNNVNYQKTYSQSNPNAAHSKTSHSNNLSQSTNPDRARFGSANTVRHSMSSDTADSGRSSFSSGSAMSGRSKTMNEMVSKRGSGRGYLGAETNETLGRGGDGRYY